MYTYCKYHLDSLIIKLISRLYQYHMSKSGQYHTHQQQHQLQSVEFVKWATVNWLKLCWNAIWKANRTGPNMEPCGKLLNQSNYDVFSRQVLLETSCALQKRSMSMWSDTFHIHFVYQVQKLANVSKMFLDACIRFRILSERNWFCWFCNFNLCCNCEKTILEFMFNFEIVAGVKDFQA